MAARSPSDAVVALHSLGRRFRGLFAGREDDESPDDLAHRNGADGRSALDHAAAATRTITFLGRALEQVLVDDAAMLHPAVADPAQREWPDATGAVDEVIDELARASDQLAERAAKVSASEWSRAALVAGHDAATTALAILWDAVDSAIDHLKAAERTLREVRGKV